MAINLNMHHAVGNKNLASLSCYSCFAGAQRSERKAIIWGNSKRRPRRAVWCRHCSGAMAARVTKTNSAQPFDGLGWHCLNFFFSHKKSWSFILSRVMSETGQTIYSKFKWRRCPLGKEVAEV